MSSDEVLAQILARLTGIENAQELLREEQHSNYEELKERVTNIENATDTLKEGQEQLREEQRSNYEELKAGQIDLAECATKTEIRIENAIDKSVGLLIEGHKDIIAHQKANDKKIERSQELQGSVRTLEHVVEQHSIDLKRHDNDISEIKQKIAL